MEPEVEVTEPLTVEEALEKTRSQSVFSGHPATPDSVEPEPPEDGKDTDDEPVPEAKAEDSDEESKDDAIEPEPKADPKPEPVKKKYASHEEAERGAKEAERRMHEAKQEAKRVRAELEAIRSQIASASKSETITPQEKKDLDVYFKEMLSSIKDLDPEDPGYDEQLAKAWAGSIKKSVGDMLSEESARREAARKQAEIEREEAAKIGKKIVSMATEAGLDMSSDASTDYELFYSVSQNSVGATVEDRIDWTINKVKAIKASIMGKTIESQKKSKEAQAKHKVLERGVSHITSPKGGDDIKPISIMDALARTERRI